VKDKFSTPTHDDKARHDRMVELVKGMMELKKQQACPRGSRRARAPKKQSPSAKQLLDQKLAITDQQIDQLVYGEKRGHDT